MAHPGKTTAVEHDLDSVLTVLRNERRRRALRLACERGRTTTKELTDEIAALENEKHPDHVSSTERKRVYIALYQTHLPKMASAGFITYEGHVVEPCELAHEIWGPLEELEAILDDTIEREPNQRLGIGLRGFRLSLSRPGGDPA